MAGSSTFCVRAPCLGSRGREVSGKNDAESFLPRPCQVGRSSVANANTTRLDAPETEAAGRAHPSVQVVVDGPL